MTRRRRAGVRRRTGARARWLAPAVAVALTIVGAAAAAPTDVTLRVEGRTTTLYEGPLTTDARTVDGSDGSGSHRCGEGRPSALGALADAADRSGLDWRASWNPDFRDFFVERIGADGSSTATAAFWALLVDWRYGGGGCASALTEGAEVLWAYDTVDRPLVLRLTGPLHAAVGEAVAVEVRDGWIRADSGLDGGPVAGATVGGAVTDSAGRALLSFDSPGLRRLKAERPNAIRSNALDVCVGDSRCADPRRPIVPVAPPLSPSLRRTPSARAALVRGTRYLRRERARRGLSRSTARAVADALRMARVALHAPQLEGRRPAGLPLSKRPPSAARVLRLRRCSRPDGSIGCGTRAGRQPVLATARAVSSLARFLVPRRSRKG